FLRRAAGGLDASEAEALLAAARRGAKPVKVGRLGLVGMLDGFPGYAKAGGQFSVRPARGRLGADVPFMVEAWGRVSGRAGGPVRVTRTPVTADVYLERQSKPRTALPRLRAFWPPAATAATWRRAPSSSP